ncbi:hypothetical protein EDF57_1203 [Novosphingobium sp. PhB55]|uniref:hypothetical protein n=1 Tax=Novosphingobium sp. PhB55 TaxID=2485106 RepID=UPI001066C000|nr:hypothetical protein [Novosphingobium sp. PhB55]TDW58629.1 hypothetical protein EDF57_1203 [Novosphingobium sp. PhB55]
MNLHSEIGGGSSIRLYLLRDYATNCEEHAPLAAVEPDGDHDDNAVLMAKMSRLLERWRKAT